MRKVIVAVVAACAVLIPALSASAESRTVHDERGPALSNASNRLTKATFRYGGSRIVWTIKLAHVSRRGTRVFASVYFPDGDYTRVGTFFRDGRKIVRGAAAYDSDYVRFGMGLTARWDLARDIITLTMTADSPGWTHPWNSRAKFDAYTVEKGAMHGPHCDIDPDTGAVEPCNDDYVAVRGLAKG